MSRLWQEPTGQHTVKSFSSAAPAIQLKSKIQIMMARLLLMAICCLLLVARTNASCFFARMACKPGPFYGKIPGATKCHDCSCTKSGTAVSCCLNIPVPARYNRRRCVSVLDENSCTYKVTKLNNPKRECPVSAWSG